MSKLVPLALLLAATAHAQPAPPPPVPTPEAAPAEPRFAFQAGLGYLNGGNVYVDDSEVETDGGGLLALAIDSLMSSRMSLGSFLVAARTDVAGTSATIATIGGTIKSRFGSPTGTQLRVGIAFGYQRITLDDAEDMDTIQGFDIAPIIEVAFPWRRSTRFVLQASALSQPAGGNSDVEVTFAPIAYLAALVEWR